MKGYWIWNYGEYEIYHAMKLHLRRQEFGADYPAFWKVPVPNVNAKFMKRMESSGGYLIAYTTGKGYILVDETRYKMGERVEIPAGAHTISAVVASDTGFPALFVESDVCPSDAGWTANNNAGKLTPVGWEEYFDSPEKNPEIFPFAYEHKEAVCVERKEAGWLYDFGKELFGYLNIKNADPDEKLGVFYGESVEEALDTENSILLEFVSGQREYQLRQRAFRYIYIETASDDLDVSMEFEYLPLEKKGSFSCDNALSNKIYDTCVHTFHLNSRECYLDGIKRDRWVWSGDAYQSARINGYLYADPSIVRRTALGLIGKETIEQHINTIVDYSFYWIIGLYEYYMTYGDRDFLARSYPMALRLLEFCERRLNEDGFIVGAEGDWTFIDWSEIDKTGAVCAEQMLLAAAYEAMAKITAALDGRAEADSCTEEYLKKRAVLVEKINAFYWKDELGAFIDSYESGRNHVTRHANIFAIMYDIATPDQRDSIVKNVLKNDAVTKITTPYFEGYELDVWGKVGEFSQIESMLDSYWGGMIRLGATSIWEEFDPTLNGAEHYAMYGSKYAKSLCHAWGAGPIYLFGRYYLGVYPTAPGYETFCVKPALGGMKQIAGTVPVNGGEVRVALDEKGLSVTATKSGGTLIWKGKEYVLEANLPLVISNIDA